MPNATQGLLRYWRGTLLGLLVGLTAILGHVAGHGQVSLVPALMVVGLALAGAGALTAHRLSPVTLLPFVIGFQLAAHWALSQSPGHPASAALRHAHGAALDAIPEGIGPRIWASHPRVELGPADSASWLPHLDGPMVGGHAVACLVIVGLMWRTDEALFAFASALRRAVRLFLGGGFWLAAGPVARLADRQPLLGATASPGHELSHPSPWQLRGPPVATIPS